MRIQPLEPKQASWILRPLYWLMRRQFGKVLTPYQVWAYRPAIVLPVTWLMGAVAYSRGIDGQIKILASIRGAQLIGCPF